MFLNLRESLKRLSQGSAFRLGALLFLAFAFILLITFGFTYFELVDEIKGLARADRELQGEMVEIIGKGFRNAVLISLLVSIVVVLMFSRASQKRLAKMTQVLGALGQGELSARVPVHSEKARLRRDDLDVMGEALNETAEKLESLMRETRYLGASIAHDLRTPLARLRVTLETLDASDEEAIEGAIAEVDQLSVVIDSILRIARIEARQDQSQWQQVSLSNIAENFHENFEAVAEANGREFAVQSDEKSPFVAVDLDLVQQALANIFQNALLYGAGTITIFAQGNSIGISDEGQGVPDEELEEIIKPMVRLDKTRQSHGSGLGLALVKAVADHHGATISLRNLEPRGFAVRLDFGKSAI